MAWKLMVADGVVSTDPISLHTLVFQGEDAKTGLTLYDGQSTSGPKVAELHVDTKQSSKVVAFAPPLEFASGLYIDLDSDTNDCLVHYTRGIE